MTITIPYKSLLVTYYITLPIRHTLPIKYLDLLEFRVKTNYLELQIYTLPNKATQIYLANTTKHHIACPLQQLRDGNDLIKS